MVGIIMQDPRSVSALKSLLPSDPLHVPGLETPSGFLVFKLLKSAGRSTCLLFKLHELVLAGDHFQAQPYQGSWWYTSHFSNGYQIKHHAYLLRFPLIHKINNSLLKLYHPPKPKH